jgi:acetyl esterase/lipase
MYRSLVRTFLISIALMPTARAEIADEPKYTRTEDVIYGRKYGTALTLDVFRPKRPPNGAAVVVVVSGGFYSSRESIVPSFFQPLLDRGYTVFAVVHGSQPRYTVPEIITDIHRAIRFIRLHAPEYAVDPGRIGITGASAGGYLSLMLGTAGDLGDPSAADRVDRESSRVQAVACFFPPTDLLNYGKPGRALLRPTDHGPPFRAAFDYRELDPASRLWVPVTDPDRLREIARRISPITHVTADDAPTLILHGDADELVPIQQSEIMIEALRHAGVEAKLVPRHGSKHGWLTMSRDVELFADWFDGHLPPKPAGDGRGD